MNKPSSPEAKARGHDLLLQDTSSLAESSRGLGLPGCLRQDGCRGRERTAQAGSLAGSCDDRPDVTDQAAKDWELPGTRSLLADWVLRARYGIRLPVFESHSRAVTCHGASLLWVPSSVTQDNSSYIITVPVKAEVRKDLCPQCNKHQAPAGITYYETISKKY